MNLNPTIAQFISTINGLTFSVKRQRLSKYNRPKNRTSIFKETSFKYDNTDVWKQMYCTRCEISQ